MLTWILLAVAALSFLGGGTGGTGGISGILSSVLDLFKGASGGTGI